MGDFDAPALRVPEDDGVRRLDVVDRIGRQQEPFDRPLAAWRRALFASENRVDVDGVSVPRSLVAKIERHGAGAQHHACESLLASGATDDG